MQVTAESGCRTITRCQALKMKLKRPMRERLALLAQPGGSSRLAMVSA